ncbi:unnamed protein product [Echinostoma caproni]|uniref:Band_3_cyto domain-containing protein n=1 Tax=Echinostoma caproni TaxID=27848 RepID=A0A183AP09_9TREM|nr:unnamed protein product [Echinostoma caproni]
MILDPFLAPLARPESVNTCGEESSVAHDGDQREMESGLVSFNIPVTTIEPSLDRSCTHRSSQLTARTLSGAELKQLNLWKRHMNSRTGHPIGPQTDVMEPNETPVFLDKESVEVESHRYFELPGTRRRRRLLWAGFRASQRRWESLEQAAAIAQRNARLRQCVTASGHLDSLDSNTTGKPYRKLANTSSPNMPPGVPHIGKDFRPRHGSVSLPELIDSVNARHLEATVCAPNENVLESPLAARHLIRSDGSMLDHVPPVFAELDILNCKPLIEPGSLATEDCAAVVDPYSRKTSSLSMTPIPPPSLHVTESARQAVNMTSGGLDRMKWSWLETARWVRYEQDFDPITGAFGQAHSPPLTFQAVVECRRYLEQGAIVLQADQRSDSLNTRQRLCHDPICLFTEVDTAIHALVTDCGATISEIALIRRVLSLRHQHTVSSTLRFAKHHSVFQQCTEPPPGNQSHEERHSVSGQTDQSTHQTTVWPTFFTRSRQKSDFRHASTFLNLNDTTQPQQQQNHKRTTSDNRLCDVEHGFQNVARNPSFVSPTLGGTLARRAVSVIRRAFTPTLPPADASSPGHNAMDPEPGLWMSTGTAHPDTNRPVRISEPARVVLPKTPPDALLKPTSDLAGRLKPTTEIVSVQVGVLPGLRRPMLAFIRFQRALFAPGFTELRDAHPIRFLILFLGPERRHLDYNEVGRVIATMMIDRVFRRTAYTAVCREDLLDGLRTFLDTTIVLPMLSEITPKSLLAMHDQLRLFRRHRLAQLRSPRTGGIVAPVSNKPRRLHVRGDSKPTERGMFRCIPILGES